jgi:hypothetical protein
MIPLKDIDEVIEYNYRVCEAYDCEEESTDFFESEYRSIDLCQRHYREAQRYMFY